MTATRKSVSMGPVEIITSVQRRRRWSPGEKKTGLAERQIWAIVNHAAEEGKIKKVKRGFYAASLTHRRKI